MKKSLFIGIVLLLTVLLAACGTETNQPNSDRSIPSGIETSEIQKTEPANGDDTESGGDMGSNGTMESKIILNMNGTNVHAALYDNTAARAFLDLLPYTVTVSREADDLCGSVSEELASDPVEDQSTWAIGEIGWFDGWFTILCDNEAGMPKRTRTIIGKIDENDIPYMQSLTGTVEITVTVDEETENREAEEPTISQNGTEIEGVMYRPDGTGPFPTVILTHGFSGNYTYITGNIAKELSKAGFAAYAFNLRNPDTRSMWNTSVLTEAATLNTVIDQVKQLDYVDTSRIFLLGESQGGFVSAYVAANREDIRSLILYYPAFVLQDDAKRRNPGWDTPGYEFEDDVSFGVSAVYAKDALSFDIYDEIGKFKNDVLIIHGTQDDVVPLSYSERAVSVYDHAELKTIEGAGHGFYSGEPFTISTQYTTDFLLDQIKE